jgi:hypothetical protein
MDQAIRTIMGVIIRLIAVGLFITGMIFAHEFLYETFDPARSPFNQGLQRASVPASAGMPA